MTPPTTLEDRRPPITPQLALRVAIFGGLAFALFAVLFFRLWYLQVLSGDQYLAQANENRVRDIEIPAPRGVIVDDRGRPLVANRQAEAIQIDPTNLPGARTARTGLYDRLGRILGLSPHAIAREVFLKTDPRHGLPYAAVTLTTDAPQDVYDYIAEHQAELDNAVDITSVFTREYPYGDIGAQLFGTVGQISPQELKDTTDYRGVREGTIVGQDGIEKAYDHYLRGQDGAQRVQIDAFGNPKGVVSTSPPVQGQRLQLSLDLPMEAAAQSALAQAVANSTGDAGGAVAMDPRTGAIVAMASYPTFDPNIFSRPLSQSTYDRLANQQPAPLINRALSGAYPTGSTMKPITATAALATPQAHFTPAFTPPGGACVNISGRQFCNSGHADYGAVDLESALQVSSDVYFYQVGALLNPIPGEPLQKWMRKLGIGVPTGIDLPGSSDGLVPDRAWRARVDAEQARCDKRYGAQSPHCSSNGAPLYADGRPWSVGDNVNLAVGQGDLETSPLQMAVAYSALQNGGTVVTPHLGVQIDDNQGAVVQQLDVPPSRHVNLPAGVDAIRAGLHDATSQPGGTSYDVFNGFPVPVYGKTGTAERGAGVAYQSWFMCWVDAGSTPKPHGPLVVAVTIEHGGFGAQAAAPAARLILSQWIGAAPRYVVGSSHTL